MLPPVIEESNFSQKLFVVLFCIIGLLKGLAFHLPVFPSAIDYHDSGNGQPEDGSQ
jgi:hypothetical protein